MMPLDAFLTAGLVTATWWFATRTAFLIAARDDLPSAIENRVFKWSVINATFFCPLVFGIALMACRTGKLFP